MADQVEQASFKYVRIEQEDDELVIEAGLRHSNAAGPKGRASDAQSSPIDGLSSQTSSIDGSDAQTSSIDGSDAVDSERDQVVPEAPTTNPEDARPGGERAEDSGDAFHGTTLDDLGREPMPKMQRAVLLGIAALVIAFAIYVLFF